MPSMLPRAAVRTRTAVCQQPQPAVSWLLDPPSQPRPRPVA
jgi:hypothetical protein